MFIATAWAQATGAGSGPGLFEQLMPFLFLFVIFYLLIVRPQQKRQKNHQSFLLGLKRGDSVVTNSGLLGTIEGLTDQVVILQIADGVKVRMMRSQVTAAANDELVKK